MVAHCLAKASRNYLEMRVWLEEARKRFEDLIAQSITR